MKRIGIVAVTNHNYGSILQTFALQTIVRKLGYTTEIIRYHEPKSCKLRRLKNKEYAISRLKMAYKHFVMAFGKRRQNEDLKQRFIAFKDFIENELSFSKVCTSQNTLTEITKGYKTMLLGSDQVWHPMNLYMDFFTLNFVPLSINKVAYAPSFGVSLLPDTYTEPYRKFISRFDYLSCREESGVRLIKSLTGKKAEWVCDPTILMSGEDWLPYLSSKVRFDCEYVFCYFIGDNPNQRIAVRQFADARGLKVVALLHIDEHIKSDESYADYKPYNVGPKEFLYLVRNAAYIMTDSFHATVFSLLFHKSFYTFDRFENGKGKPTTSRIDSLLSIVELQERKVPMKAPIDYFNSVSAICYEGVDLKMETFRQQSMEYLKNALK